MQLSERDRLVAGLAEALQQPLLLSISESHPPIVALQRDCLRLERSKPRWCYRWILGDWGLVVAERCLTPPPVTRGAGRGYWRRERALLDAEGWVRARFGITLDGGAGFRAIARLVRRRVEYRRMDAVDVNELGERFDLLLCSGLLHRVTDPIGLLRAPMDVLTAGGEIVLETYGSRLGADSPAIEVHELGDVYVRDGFVYWGFPAEGLRRVARIAGLEETEVVNEPGVAGHPRVFAVLRATG